MLDGYHFEHAAAGQRVPRASLVGTRLAASPYLSGEDRNALEQAGTSVRSTAGGIDLLREGERADQFQIIVDGWACRYKTTREGARQIITVLLPGDVANLDSALLDRLDYAVRTLTPAKILTIPRERIMALADQHTGIVKTLAWLAMAENAVLSQATLRLGRQSAKQRLAHLLCELSVRLGSSDNDGTSQFDLPLTQELIADALGPHLRPRQPHLTASPHRRAD